MRQRRAQPSGSADFLAGGGEMGDLIRGHDWASTALGPLEHWPLSLRTTVGIMLSSRYAMWMLWGRDLTFLCNDAYRPTLGLKRDWALGARSDAVWAEIWGEIGPRIRTVLETGVATWDEALLLFLERSGYSEETYHTFSYSPLRDDDGAIAGMLCVVTEETERVIGDRRLGTLRHLAAELATVQTEPDLGAALQRALESNRRDLPVSLLYLFDEEGTAVRLFAAAGIEAGHAAAPSTIESGLDSPWPIEAARRSAAPLVVDHPPEAGPLPSGEWNEPPRRVLLHPIAQQGRDAPTGLLIVGLNPFRQLDTAYADFIGLLAGQIAARLANVRAYEQERRRAEALAELDRAKTAFFSNVSHEFRTPLTLMLGPLEEALRQDTPTAEQRRELAVAHRNGLRLLRLVNTLLDFSRVEAGRVDASYAATDLAAFTTGLASNFRSACDRAGLRLVVDCPPLPQPVHVDREMWEKIVLNLVSNAFKFTFEGEIGVRLHAEAGRAVLTVHDTGTGIPAAELPRLFERFHRVANARGRSHEGTGIGLALVQELVRLHGGTVEAASAEGVGTTFTVRLPFGTDHLPADRVEAGPTRVSTATRAEAFVQEALRWLPEAAAAGSEDLLPDAASVVPGRSGAERPHVLLADDNADMREYLRRLLAADYEVEAVPDGMAALAAARARRPDLVLSDFMMPRLDGFGLSRALRADPDLRDVPLILLSARAGEEAEIEGLEAGADDYLVKPFSARELLARVRSAIDLARVRREAAERERRLRAEAEESEARLASFLENSPGSLVIKDSEGRYTLVNEAFLDGMGRPVEEVLGRTDAELFPPELASIFTAEDREVREAGEPRRFEETFEFRGRRYTFLTHKFPLPAGAIGCVGTDITERKRSEERLRLMVDELNHRVKNTLALVQSLAGQSLRFAAREGFSEAFESRLQALAAVHDLLTRGRWEGTSLRETAELTLRPHAEGDRVWLDGPGVGLAPSVAVSLHLALHELATNAVKHGALSTPSGRIELSWRTLGDGAGHRLHLDWLESGGPPVAPPTRRGFGSRMIERGLSHELDGEVRLEFAPTGVRCQVMMPLSDRVRLT